MPWFWSDQYELTVQMAGTPDRAARTAERAVGADTLMLSVSTAPAGSSA